VIGWRHYGDTWLLAVVGWLARERDVSYDELTAALCNDTAVASPGVCSTYFNDTQIAIEFRPGLHEDPPPDFSLVPSLLSDLNAVFALHDGTHGGLWLGL
jgi:hypothetical protein